MFPRRSLGDPKPGLPSTLNTLLRKQARPAHRSGQILVRAAHFMAARFNRHVDSTMILNEPFFSVSVYGGGMGAQGGRDGGMGSADKDKVMGRV